MMSKKMIKIICIVMAALMVLSVFAVALTVFANAAELPAAPDTGDSAADVIIPASIAVAAVLAVVVCLVLPKMKKDGGEASAENKEKPYKKETGSEKASAEKNKAVKKLRKNKPKNKGD